MRMKWTLGILAGMALVAAVATAQGQNAFRLFLATEGVEGNDPLNGLSPRLTNPVVGTCNGPVRLYVWGQVISNEPDVRYITVSYNVRTTGTAEVVAARTWNYSNILTRWSVTNGGQLGGGELMNVRLSTGPAGFFGVRNYNFNNLDLQFDPVTTSTVLGWIDVDGVGEIRLEVGDIGIIRIGGIQENYLGFGDEGQKGNPIPEATIFTCGDLNCDGRFDGADIDPFFLALGDPAAYGLRFPDCNRELADMNADGQVNGADIDVFFECLGGGGCP